MKKLAILTLLLVFKFGYSQKKVLQTKKLTTETITIDGKFDEAAWQNAEEAKDFVMFTPDNGKKYQKINARL